MAEAVPVEGEHPLDTQAWTHSFVQRCERSQYSVTRPINDKRVLYVMHKSVGRTQIPTQ